MSLCDLQWSADQSRQSKENILWFEGTLYPEIPLKDFMWTVRSNLWIVLPAYCNMGSDPRLNGFRDFDTKHHSNEVVVVVFVVDDDDDDQKLTRKPDAWFTWR